MCRIIMLGKRNSRKSVGDRRLQRGGGFRAGLEKYVDCMTRQKVREERDSLKMCYESKRVW